jgi:hypothetical protein
VTTDASLGHTIGVKYYVTVAVTYIAGGERISSDALNALTQTVLAELRDRERDCLVSQFSLLERSANVVVVRAMLEGTRTGQLTNPLDALGRVDTAFNRSLMKTGLFEEFDVAQRRLCVSAPNSPDAT